MSDCCRGRVFNAEDAENAENAENAEISWIKESLKKLRAHGALCGEKGMIAGLLYT